MKTMTKMLSFFTLTVFVSLLAACGGGGGGGETGGGIPYSGIQAQVIVDQSNAEDVSMGAYDGGTTGDALGGTFSAVQAGAEVTYPAKSRLKTVTEAIKDALAQVDTDAAASGTTVAAFMTTGGTEDGLCGGQMTMSTDMMDPAAWDLTDPTNITFSGAITFINYDDCDGEVMDGAVSFTMTMNSNGQSLGTFDVTFNALTTTTDTESFTAGGTMNMTSAYDQQTFDTTETVRLTMVVRDNNTGKTFKAQDYTVVLTEMGSYYEETISGRFYDPDHGYVDIFTDAPLRTNLYEDWPSEGILRFVGADPTWVTLTFDPSGATGAVSDGSTFFHPKPGTM